MDAIYVIQIHDWIDGNDDIGLHYYRDRNSAWQATKNWAKSSHSGYESTCGEPLKMVVNEQTREIDFVPGDGDAVLSFDLATLFPTPGR